MTDRPPGVGWGVGGVTPCDERRSGVLPLNCDVRHGGGQMRKSERSFLVRRMPTIVNSSKSSKART